MKYKYFIKITKFRLKIELKRYFNSIFGTSKVKNVDKNKCLHF